MADLFKKLAEVVTKVGVTGFIVIAMVASIWLFGDKGKVDEFIDTWFLFKNVNAINAPSFYIIIAMVMMFSLQEFLHRERLKMLRGRIEEITEEKSYLQEVLIKRKLSTTEKKRLKRLKQD